MSEDRQENTYSPRGGLIIASCQSALPMAELVVSRYKEKYSTGVEDFVYLKNVDYRFSDSETCARLEEDVSGQDVFLFQNLLDPNSSRSVDDNYAAFLISVRTFREWGANYITGVLPYLAYARQDKPTRFTFEPTTAKLMADLSITAGLDRLVTWHPHCPQIAGFYENVPVDRILPINMFKQYFSHFKGDDRVIAVAPDAGAAKMITHFARELDLKAAVASKYRPEPESAMITEVIGDFRGKKIAIIMDDIISSGGTIYSLVKKLVEEKEITEIYLGVSHNLCMQSALEKIVEMHEKYHLMEAVFTNSISLTREFLSLDFVKVKDLSPVLAEMIHRIHFNLSVQDAVFKSTLPE